MLVLYYVNRTFSFLGVWGLGFFGGFGGKEGQACDVKMGVMLLYRYR